MFVPFGVPKCALKKTSNIPRQALKNNKKCSMVCKKPKYSQRPQNSISPRSTLIICG